MGTARPGAYQRPVATDVNDPRRGCPDVANDGDAPILVMVGLIMRSNHVTVQRLLEARILRVCVLGN
jgi:hypothetical protein